MKTWMAGIIAATSLIGHASGADIIVSAQDGKFVRVEGRATFPEPAPSDSLVIIDATQFPPVVKGTVEGLEHTSLPLFTIQYHSEASPGPHDTEFLFDRFLTTVRREQ